MKNTIVNKFHKLTYSQIIKFLFILCLFSFAVVFLAWVFANIIVIEYITIADIKDIALALSPIITIFITFKTHKDNLNFERETKILEIYEKEKRTALENFIEKGIECFDNENPNNKKEFIKAFYTLRIYFKKINSTFIKNMEVFLDIAKNDDKAKNINETKVIFFKTIDILEKEIEKY